VLVRLQILEEWRANLEQTNDTEEALIKSQVNYLKFEIFESKISMENSNTGITEWKTNLAKTRDQQALDDQ
jgi:hypothetical protein